MHPKKFRPARTITAFAILSTLLSANYPSPTQAKTAPAAADTTPFLGTWTAYHSGTPIILVHISPASNGALAGTVQVCSYTISEASGKVDVVTDPTLSAESKIDNVKIDSVTAISFTWKDPDGDTDHWQLKRTGPDVGQIIWLDLPPDVKFQPTPITRTTSSPRNR